MLLNIIDKLQENSTGNYPFRIEMTVHAFQIQATQEKVDSLFFPNFYCISESNKILPSIISSIEFLLTKINAIDNTLESSLLASICEIFNHEFLLRGGTNTHICPSRLKEVFQQLKRDNKFTFDYTSANINFNSKELELVLKKLIRYNPKLTDNDKEKTIKFHSFIKKNLRIIERIFNRKKLK